jgi:adenine nucleotide transporter 17
MFWFILEQEGISGFYKGLIPSLFLTINPIIQYIFYEYLRAKLIDATGNISSKNIIIISAVSKLITTLATYPALTVKTLFQANEKKSAKEIKNLLVQMISENGFLYLYKGKFKFIIIFFMI